MRYFGNKRGEVKELQSLLLQPRIESKMQALRQVCHPKILLNFIDHCRNDCRQGCFNAFHGCLKKHGDQQYRIKEINLFIHNKLC